MNEKCIGCGLDHYGTEAVCNVCWSALSAKHRAAIHRAQRALAYNPASPRLQDDFQVAIAEAMGSR